MLVQNEHMFLLLNTCPPKSEAPPSRFDFCIAPGVSRRWDGNIAVPNVGDLDLKPGKRKPLVKQHHWFVIPLDYSLVFPGTFNKKSTFQFRISMMGIFFAKRR